MKEFSIPSEAAEVLVVLVDSEDELLSAIIDVGAHPRVAFDCEGVNLGRSGELTIATFQGISGDPDDTPIFVVDVEALGGDRVFSNEWVSFRSILEDASITKVTFDCRGDSDALFHQFGVSLAGTLDLQIFDQAVRIHNGEAPPKRNTYLYNGGIPLLSNMEQVLSRYSTLTKIDKSSAPHRWDNSVWKKRPLTEASVRYAANDVNVIKVLRQNMNAAAVPNWLMERVASHSKRYEAIFRDRSKEVVRTCEKTFVMEEHGIILENELPASHPKKPCQAAPHAQQKWDKAVTSLRLKGPSAFDDVLFVLQHNDWYTDDGRKELRRLAQSYPFTSKQRTRIAYPPSLKRQDDDSDWGYDYDSDGGYSGGNY
jgi:hypothetical protein